MRPALLLLLSLPLQAQAVLLEAWQDVQHHDPAYLGALAQHDADSEEAALAKAQLLPQASISASHGRARSDIVQSVAGISVQDRRSYSSESWTIQLRQNLFRGPALAGYRQGRMVAAAADASLAAARQGAAIRLLEAASELAQSRAALQASASVVAAAEVHEQSVRRLLRGGQSTRLELAQAGTTLAQARHERSRSEAALLMAETTWKALTGQHDSPGLHLDLDLEQLPMPAGSPDTLLTEARHANPAIRAARLELEAARLATRKARDERLPAVELFASRSFNDSEQETAIGTSYDTSRYGVMVSMPLLAGGAISAGIRQAQARERVAEAAISQIDSQIRQVIAETLARISEARTAAALAQAQADTASVAMRMATLGAGRLATTSDQSRAKADFDSASSHLVAARASALSAWARLQDVLGTLDDQQIMRLARQLGWDR